MTVLSRLDRMILTLVQNPLPLVDRPFDMLAQQAWCSQEDFLEVVQQLKKQGYIRRFRGQLNYNALGRIAALVTACVPSDKLAGVIAEVNALPGVSHNYLREHDYNLWFTLQDDSFEHIDRVLARLAGQTGVHFYSLPAEKVYKLDVRFNPDGPQAADFEPMEFESQKKYYAVVKLDEQEKKVLAYLQKEFPITEKPFEQLGGQSGLKSFLETAAGLIEKGAVRRIAAVLDQNKLGYAANVMFAARINKNQADEAGEFLASLPAVSHCYQRKTFPGWPYNLFAMIHAGSMEQVHRFLSEFVNRFKIDDYVLLPTVKELKKHPVLFIHR